MILYRSLLAALQSGAPAPKFPIILREASTPRALVVRAPAPVSADGRTTVIASTDQPDRMDDIVDQATWKLDEYRANPVIMWAHDCDDFPIGRCDEVAIVENKLMAMITWDETTEDGATTARQFREGFLSAVSVGFRPGRVIARSQLPKEDPRYKEGSYGVVYYDCTLLEISAVPVPANPGALVTERAMRAQVDVTDRMLDDAAQIERMARMMTELRALPNMMRAIAREVADEAIATIRQHADETTERALAASEPSDWWADEPASAPSNDWFRD